VSSARLTNPVILGRIGGHFGIKGWLKIVSYTRPIDQIFQYSEWYLLGLSDRESWKKVTVTECRQNSKGIVVKFTGFDSREETEVLVGCDFGVDRSQLDRLPEGDYYWLELVGLNVINLEGLNLGRVDHLFETGANDVLVVNQETGQGETVERLLPWTPDVVVRVDLEDGVITVDWKEDY
jgi:16S rRNA processing protein RimM